MIENSLRNHAIIDNDLVQLIDDRFYLTTNHTATDNYILLRVVTDKTPIELHLEDGQSSATIQFDCYSKSALQAQIIAKAINETFNKKGFIDEVIKVQLGIKEHRIPDFESDTGLYRESLNYIFNYHFITNSEV